MGLTDIPALVARAQALLLDHFTDYYWRVEIFQGDLRALLADRERLEKERDDALKRCAELELVYRGLQDNHEEMTVIAHTAEKRCKALEAALTKLRKHLVVMGRYEPQSLMIEHIDAALAEGEQR